MFYLCKNYSSRKTTLPTEDLLEAVKISMNYEADLFMGGYMVVSWMGYSMEENIERLSKEGIEVYVIEGQYRFRYKDPSKNIKRIYYILYLNDKGLGEVHLGDTPNCKDDPHYSSHEEIYSKIKKEHPDLVTLTVIDFSGDTFRGSFKIDLKLNLPTG